MLGFGTFVKKPTKSESEEFEMSITPELARFAKVDNPSELDINLVKSEVRSLISLRYAASSV